MVSSDLDRKSKRVLEALFEYDGEAKVGEIADFTGMKSNNIHYRVDEKLGPAGIVDTRKIETGGPMGEKVVSLTDDGSEIVGRIIDDDAEPTVVEQVRELRAVVEDAHEDVQRFDGRVDHVEEQTSEAVDRVRAFEDRLERLESRFEAVDEVVEDLETLRDDLTRQIREEVDTEIRRRRFVGVDLAVALHEAGLIRPSEEAGVETFDKFGGAFTGPSDRLIIPSRRLRKQMGDGAAKFPDPDA